MRRGHVDKVTRKGVSGWAYDDEAAAAKLDLRIIVNGHEVGTCVAEKPRRDLVKLMGDEEGRHGFTFSFAEPLATFRTHYVSVRFAGDDVLLTSGERVVEREGTEARPDGLASPTPILVGAPSRSGTTYLMSCLAASADIVASDVMPYELRLLDYYAAAHGVLTAPADYERSLHPNRLGADPFQIGFNPFTTPKYAASFKNPAPMRDLFELLAPEQLGETMAEIIRTFYRLLARDQGKARPPEGGGEEAAGGTTYFAEKNINLHKQTRRFTRMAFPSAREIAVIRDPRDILCSHQAYYADRGDKSVGELTGMCKLLLQLHEGAPADLHFLRYEDMLGDEVAAFAALSAFLGTTVEPVRREDDPAFRRHATSSSPAASIGRWKTDLPADVRAEVSKAWGPFLERFGYEAA